jgi:hypothetical protein
MEVVRVVTNAGRTAANALGLHPLAAEGVLDNVPHRRIVLYD